MASIIENILGTDLTTLLIFLIIFLVVYYAVNRPAHLPPGPPILIPGLGNLTSFIGKDPLTAFQDWGRKYGDVYSLYFGSQLVVVLSGYKMIREAFVVKGETFSDRPHDAFLNVYVTDNNGIIFNSGESWKRERKFMKNALQKLSFGRPSFENNILEELDTLMEKFETFKGKPFDMKELLTFSIANIIMLIITGKRAPLKDPGLTKFIHMQDEATVSVARISLVMNSFPLLQYLPGDLFGIKGVMASYDVAFRYISELREQHVPSFEQDNPDNLLDICEASQGRTAKDEFELFNELFATGTETTANTILWTIIYLLNYPEVQRKCREEIHAVLGKVTRPTMESKALLPYVSATILESLRCSLTVPLAIPHTANTDAELGGYRVPQGASVFANLNSIFFDPELFNDPHSFRPERFLNQNGDVEVPEFFIPFGIGRRVCLGEAAAKMELFLFLTALIQRFEFLPEGDAPPHIKGSLHITFSPDAYRVRCAKCT